MTTYERLGEILLEIQGSDMSHFDELYDSTKKTVYFELKNVGVPDQSIEDMIQEVYIKLLTNAASIDNPRALFKWIKQVAYTSGINFVRAAVNQREYLIEEDGDHIFEDERSLSAPIPMPEDIMENQETQRLVRSMINSLPQKQHRIFVAFYYNELSIRDIAGNMGISESVVKTQLFRGRKTIETQVKDLEKKHYTRLFSLAPIPIFALLFGQDVFACEIPQSTTYLPGKILAQMARYGYPINPATAGAAAGVKAASTGSAGAAGAKAGAAAAVKSAGLGLGAKIGIIIGSAAIVGTASGIAIPRLLDTPQSVVVEQEPERDELYEFVNEKYGFANNPTYGTRKTYGSGGGIDKLDDDTGPGAIFYKKINTNNATEGLICVYLTEQENHIQVAVDYYSSLDNPVNSIFDVLLGEDSHVFIKDNYLILVNRKTNLYDKDKDITFWEEIQICEIKPEGLDNEHLIFREVTGGSYSTPYFVALSDSYNIAYYPNTDNLDPNSEYVSSQKEFCDYVNKIFEGYSIDCLTMNELTWDNMWMGLEIDESEISWDMVSVNFDYSDTVISENGDRTEKITIHTNGTLPHNRDVNNLNNNSNINASLDDLSGSWEIDSIKTNDMNDRSLSNMSGRGITQYGDE